MSGPTPFTNDARLMVLEPVNVFVPQRLGFAHPDKAAATGLLMKKDGQHTPINVRKRKPSDDIPQEWELIVGLTRFTGALLRSLPIRALEVAGDDDAMRAIEASENIHRRTPMPIERAIFVQTLCQSAQERLAREHGNLKQQRLAVKLRWERVKAHELRAEEALSEESVNTSDTMSDVYGWQQSAAEAMDLNVRTIHRDLTLYRMLIEPFPKLIEELSRHPVVGENAAQLGKIAKVKDEDLRRKTIEALLADHEIGAEDAMIAAGVAKASGPDATPVAYQKHYNAIEGGWSRLGRSERGRFLPKFITLLTDKERADLRALLDGESRA